VKEEIVEVAKETVKMLKELESKAYESFKMAEKSEEIQRILKALIDKKIEVADSIYKILSEFDEISQVPSLPYTDNHGRNSLFYRKIPEEKAIMKMTQKTYRILEPEGEELDAKFFIETFYKDDVAQIFSKLEIKRGKKKQDKSKV